MGKEIIQKALLNEPDEKSVEMRASGRAKTGDQNISFQARIRMIRDEVIWISLRSQIGIEIARVLATPDSVWLNSKLLGIREKGNWKLLEEYTGYPVNFVALQGILYQNLFCWKSSSKELIENELIVRSDNDEKWIYSLDQESMDPALKKLSFRFLVNPASFLLDKTEILDQSGGMIASVLYTYSDGKMIRNIDLRGSGKINDYSLDLKINERVALERVEIIFEKW